MVRINTGLPPTGKNCLGMIPSHTQPFASCNYNDMPVHSAIIIPCFNSVTFSAPTYFSAMANENAIAAPGPLPVIKNYRLSLPKRPYTQHLPDTFRIPDSKLLSYLSTNHAFHIPTERHRWQTTDVRLQQMS